MTSVALGLMFGLGLYLLWWSCWIEPPVDNRRERRAGPLTRLTDDIVQAGLRGLGARGLLAGCVAAGLLTFITAWALIAVVPIAVCFAVMVGCSPTWSTMSRQGSALGCHCRRLCPQWPCGGQPSYARHSRPSARITASRGDSTNAWIASRSR